MTREEFENCVAACGPQIEAIRQTAHHLHESVNQHYDGTKPYGFHLDMVAEAMLRHAHSVCQRREDVPALCFGAWFHDSIEDARLTYNDVRREATRLGLNAAQAEMAAEIVYALTNEKGRTREERANDRYYAGIRTTPYAPLLKLADRLANLSYSCRGSNADNRHMKEVYLRELPHFLHAIDAHATDPRLALPREMLEEINALLTT